MGGLEYRGTAIKIKLFQQCPVELLSGMAATARKTKHSQPVTQECVSLNRSEPRLSHCCSNHGTLECHVERKTGIVQCDHV